MIKDYSHHIGKKGLVYMNGLQILVTVEDIRKVFGRIDAQITPINGNGYVWVELNRIRFGFGNINLP